MQVCETQETIGQAKWKCRSSSKWFIAYISEGIGTESFTVSLSGKLNGWFEEVLLPFISIAIILKNSNSSTENRLNQLGYVSHFDV